jgi:hypothetical protein
MKKLLIVAVVAFLFAASLPSFALDAGKLTAAMNRYAAVSEWINMIMHPGMPKPWTNPQLPQKYNELAEAQKTISAEIKSVETDEDIAKVRAIIATFKMCSGTYDDVGYQVEIMLNEHLKFLQMHQ